MSSGDLPHYATSVEGVDGTNRIEVTNHAKKQWRERRPADTRSSVRGAWFQATTVVDEHGFHADEVRFHRRSRMFLLRKDSHVVTTIHYSGSRDVAKRAADRLGAL